MSTGTLTAHYISSAFRNIAKSPLLSLLNVVTLALGLFCFATIYAVVLYWSNSESNFSDADRIYAITTDVTTLGETTNTGVVPKTGEQYAKYLVSDFPELEIVARASTPVDSLVSTGNRSIRVDRVIVDPEFLSLFDFEFESGDPRSALAQPESVVLTRTASQAVFGPEDPIGRPLLLDNHYPVTVTGMIEDVSKPSHLAGSRASPMRFGMLASWDLKEKMYGIPGDTYPEWWIGGNWWTTYVRFPETPSASELASFQARISDFANNHMPPEQQSIADIRVSAIPIRDITLASLSATLLGQSSSAVSVHEILIGAAIVVLLVACVNYANLATARATGYAREVGIRKALGADRRQIASQFMIEAGVFAVIAFALAMALLPFVFRAIQSATGITLSSALLISGPVSIVLVLTVLGATAIAGAYPSFLLSRIRTIEVLRLSHVRLGSRILSKLLIGMQYAVASFLLIVFLIFFAQTNKLEREALHRVGDEVIVIENWFEEARVPFGVLKTELESLAGVLGVTAVDSLPWVPDPSSMIFGRLPETNSADVVSANQNTVELGFFATMGIPIVAGRVFDSEYGDEPFTGAVDPSKPINIVVDVAFAEQMGFRSPGAAVNQIVYYPNYAMQLFGETAQPMHIIGVVENYTLQIAGHGANCSYYLLGEDLSYPIVRIDANSGLESIDGTWKTLLPDRPISRWHITDLFHASYAPYANANLLFFCIFAIALLISIFSQVGMATLVANRRMHEIGVRKTQGATSNQILRQLLREFVLPVILSSVAAWPFAYAAAQKYLQIFVNRIEITIAPFLIGLSIVVAIALAAVSVQAFHASRVSPAQILRTE